MRESNQSAENPDRSEYPFDHSVNRRQKRILLFSVLAIAVALAYTYRKVLSQNLAPDVN